VCFQARLGGDEWKAHAREILDAIDLTWSDVMPDPVDRWLDGLLSPDQPARMRVRP
jgi:hypothetical protein